MLEALGGQRARTGKTNMDVKIVRQANLMTDMIAPGKVVVKIVMKSTETASVPKVQAFRLICHS